MNRVFLCGDTHGTHDISKLNIDGFPEQEELTKDDYLIVLGDFGFIWHDEDDEVDAWYLDWLESKNYTILWIDGNHENHDRIAKYPISQWHGGNVHFIRPHVIHLMRGQIYDIGGKTFFTMGGAVSTDRIYRTEGVSWWASEVPSAKECDDAITNLELHHNKVDYILTHCAATTIMAEVGNLMHYEADPVTKFLEIIRQTVDFDKWFCGHYHCYKNFLDKYYVLYNDIVELVDGTVKETYHEPERLRWYA